MGGGHEENEIFLQIFGDLAFFFQRPWCLTESQSSSTTDLDFGALFLTHLTPYLRATTDTECLAHRRGGDEREKGGEITLERVTNAWYLHRTTQRGDCNTAERNRRFGRERAVPGPAEGWGALASEALQGHGGGEPASGGPPTVDAVGARGGQ